MIKNQMSNTIFKCVLILLALFPTISHAHIQEGLVGWWKFDESSGNAIDSSGQGNTGTPTGTTIVENCKNSRCRSFNGTSDFVNVGSNVSVSSDVTISLWVFPIVLNSYKAIITRDSGSGGDWEFAYENSKFYYGRNGAVLLRSVSSLSTSKWSHLVLTIDSVSGGALYLNGVLNVSDPALTSLRDANGSVYIGKRFTSAMYHDGLIDDVRIYNRSLTSVEVADLYKPGSKIYGAVISGAKINQ